MTDINSHLNKRLILKTPAKRHDSKPTPKTPSESNREEGADVSFFKTPTICNSTRLKSTPRYRISKPQISGSTSMPKSKSTPVITEKYVTMLRDREKSYATPVTHLCSPSLSPKGRRHFIEHNRCSVKRFFSDSSLNDSSLQNNAIVATSTSKHIEEETSNFVVGVRVRPFSLRELSDHSIRNIVQMSQDVVQVTCDTGAVHSFAYDHCFWSLDSNHPQHATQETIFNTMVLPLVDEILSGYNACLLAYGQTGSGKSYSMMGIDSGVPGELGEESGIIPRFFQELFKRVSCVEDQNEGCHIEISYFEIYNEKIHDLLGNHSDQSLRRTLKVREHPAFGPYVVDLSAHSVRSFRDVQDWITVGNSQRVTAATGMNEKSSRSHSIFSVMVTQKKREGSMLSCKSKVNLVDLAGSERVAQTCATGDKLKEGVSINKSLLSLGKVITFLSEKGRKKGVTSFGPYRESVLTWLLRESLGGNSRTGMLATISPANIHLDETLATLRYACQARSIVNRVYKNEDANERVIRELRAEVEKISTLREELDKMKKMMECSSTLEKQFEIDQLKKQLQESEELLAKSQLTWAERLEEAENLKSAELQYLKRCGVAIELHCDKKTPCLVNLAADPILTGTLLYLLPPGRLVVGRSVKPDAEKQPDIGLSGPLIHRRHCEIENRDGRLFLVPIEGCDTYINGRMAEVETELKHKDRIVFGGIHYFRVSIPSESEDATNEPIDFDFAHQEILKIQEKRLREELEKSKLQALEELEAEMESVLGAQKFDYERQISEMLSVVEMQTNALAAERKEKNVLEMERNVLKERMKNHDSSREMITNGEKSAKKISPYKSTFLRDLKSLLEERDSEWKCQAEDVDEKVSLHEMQVMVQEGTQRCRELGLNYKFQQQQIFGAKGLNPVVKVMNGNEGLATLWKPQKFVTLVNLLRESDQAAEIEKMLMDPDLKWEPDGAEAKSSISVNTDYLKRRLSLNLQHETKEESEVEGEIAPDVIANSLKEIRAKAQNLVHFCLTDNKLQSRREQVRKAMKYLDMFVSAIQGEDSVSSSLTAASPTDMTPTDKSGKSVRFKES